MNTTATCWICRVAYANTERDWIQSIHDTFVTFCNTCFHLRHLSIHNHHFSYSYLPQQENFHPFLNPVVVIQDVSGAEFMTIPTYSHKPTIMPIANYSSIVHYIVKVISQSCEADLKIYTMYWRDITDWLFCWRNKILYYWCLSNWWRMFEICRKELFKLGQETCCCFLVRSFSTVVTSILPYKDLRLP